MKRTHIYLMLVGIMAAWGFNVVATKVLGAVFTPVTMTSARLFVAGVFAFLFLFLMKKVRKLTKKEIGIVLVGSLFNVVGHHYFLSVGLTQTTASNGGLILGIGPLLTAIMAFLFLGNRLSWMRIMGIVLGLAGVSFIVLQGGEGVSGISTGDLYVFLSIFSQALSFILISKVSKTLDPRLMTAYMCIVGSVVMFGISLVQEPNGIQSLLSPVDGKVWILFFASAIIATAMGQMLYNYAIGQVGPGEASIFMNLSPFFSLVGAALFLGEPISAAHIVGLMCIIVGVALGSGALEDILRKRKEKQSPKPASM